jgi:hypothetical protein
MSDFGNTNARIREELEARFGRVWTADELAKEFVVTAIIPPTVVVRRRADDVVGSMEFQGDLYFNFQPQRTE